MSRTAVINVLSENTRQAELFPNGGEQLYYQFQTEFYESDTLVFSKGFRIEVGQSKRQRMFLPAIIRQEFQRNILTDEYFVFSKWREGNQERFEITINDEAGIIEATDHEMIMLLGISEKATAIVYRPYSKNNPHHSRRGL